MNTQLRASARPQRRAADRLIVALDVPTLADAARLIDELAPHVAWFKIGSELFTAAGPQAVELVLARNRAVFLDLKFHDIPHTVAAAVAAATRLGVAMMNIHVAAGDDALRAAVRARDEIWRGPSPRSPVVGGTTTTRVPRSPSRETRPLLLGVTRLTSFDDGRDTLAQVVDTSARAKWSGLDGVIASPREAAAIKGACAADFLVVTPGIRPAGSVPDDQRRTATPADAVRAGADYMVVGRPVVQAADPRAVVAAILEEIDAVLRQETDASGRKA
jgi:orotidine-5'-phosphate decarboxylase